MNREQLSDILANSEFAQHAEYLRKLAIPSIEIIRGKGMIEVGRSRVNGSPDLPPDFEWPEYELGPYRFLGQFNFAELPSHVVNLPTNGLLSLFYQYDPDGEALWSNPDFVVARYFPTDLDLITTEPPESVNIGESIPVEFAAAVDIPFFSQFSQPKIENWPIPTEFARIYESVRDSLHAQPDYLFGYPTNRTLGYDPTPGRDWCSLLTLDSDEFNSWYWHDGDLLMVFVEREKLARGQFSSLKCDAG